MVELFRPVMDHGPGAGKFAQDHRAANFDPGVEVIRTRSQSRRSGGDDQTVSDASAPEHATERHGPG